LSCKTKTVNLELGMPTVQQAKARLNLEMQRAASEKTVVMKLIHGYGSSGTGGRLRTEIRKHLLTLQRTGRIKLFIAGEDWNIFDEKSRRILDCCHEMSKDRDLGKFNLGITIVLLK